MRKRMLAVALAASCAAAMAAEVRTFPLEVFASQADVAAYPVEVGVPFPPGALKETASLRLADSDGAEVPCQVEGLSRYADGSLRAALLVFIAPVSRDKSRQYTVKFGDGEARKSKPGKPLVVSESGGNVSVDTGVLQLKVERGGRGLLSGASSGGKDLLPAGLVQFVQEAGQKELLSSMQTEVTVEERGPVRAVLLVKGRFGSAPDAHGYQARIHAYAGTGLVRIQHTVLGLDGKKPFELAGWGMRVPTGVKQAACGVDGATKDMDAAKGANLFQDGRIEFQWGTLSEEEYRKKYNFKFKLEEMPAWRYRTLCALDASAAVEGKADGWFQADLAQGAIAACVRDFWQQYPNGFAADTTGITLWLHSPQGRPFVGRPGTAKTHELLLDLGTGGAEQARTLNAVFQDWPHARVAPDWVCATGVFGPLLPRSDPFSAPWNALADVMFGFVEQGAQRICEGATWYVYGNSDFGDVAHSVHSFNVPSGHTAGFAREFLRGGDREWMRLAARAARHWADLDVCHVDMEPQDPKDAKVGRGQMWMASRTCSDRAPWLKLSEIYKIKHDELAKMIAELPERANAVSVPRDVHQGKPAIAGSPDCWGHTGGALPYYMVTGDRRAREVLKEQGEWLLGVVERNRATPKRSPLEGYKISTWLSVPVDAYEATGEPGFLKGAAHIAGDMVGCWKIPPQERKEYRELEVRLASPKMPQWIAGGNMLKGQKLPDHGFWETGIPGAGRWIPSWLLRDDAVFRFLRLNAPDTGVDSEELRRALAECTETCMLGVADTYCTPSYVYGWTMAANLGLWPEDVRKAFENKVVFTISVGRRADYPLFWNGVNPAVPFKYRLPFLLYRWSDKTKSGGFTPFDPAEMRKTVIGGSALYPYVCHLQEIGIDQAMLGYQPFVAVWKTYHEKHLKPRMNADGVLEFTAGP